MSLGAIARRAAKQVIHEASIKVPPAVQVSKTADLLTFKGPLGTSHLGLSRIDTLGDAALKLSPESREIAICSPSKGFFGTLQVLAMQSQTYTCFWHRSRSFGTELATPLCTHARCSIVTGGAPLQSGTASLLWPCARDRAGFRVSAVSMCAMSTGALHTKAWHVLTLVFSPLQ